MSQKKWLVALIAVDEAKLDEDLPSFAAYGTLPSILAGAIDGVTPSGALDMERIYLHTDAEKERLIAQLERGSTPYHEYATGIRGEICKEARCTQHTACIVIARNDYRH